MPSSNSLSFWVIDMWIVRKQIDTAKGSMIPAHGSGILIASIKAILSVLLV